MLHVFSIAITVPTSIPLTWLLTFGHGGEFFISVSPATGAPSCAGSIQKHAFPHFVEDLKKPCWYRSGVIALEWPGKGQERYCLWPSIWQTKFPRSTFDLFIYFKIYIYDIYTYKVQPPCKEIGERSSDRENILVPCFSPQTPHFRKRQFSIRRCES